MLTDQDRIKNLRYIAELRGNQVVELRTETAKKDLLIKKQRKIIAVLIAVSLIALYL